jgi:hypothetical protein
MNWYRQLIREATGRTDPAHLEAIEDSMRDEHGTLSGLTRNRFIKSARISEMVCVQLGDIPARTI